MPVTVVVGGQFGSEGKGKVACEFARIRNARVAIRVGGANSGHTVVDSHGRTFALRHLPTAAILPNVLCVIGPGSYIDLDVLFAEKSTVGLSDNRLVVDQNAVLISEKHKRQETQAKLQEKIGSTQSGTGAAVVERILRSRDLMFARDLPALKRFVADTSSLLRSRLGARERIVIEGTQGFGLSLLHSDFYPYVTSRDTTAAAFVSEAGLSPLDVDEVVLTLRSYPIRVAGNSGPLEEEMTWGAITEQSGSEVPISETTTVTRNIRRVARFDSSVVKAAIARNAPTEIVLNHVDYVDARCRTLGRLTPRGLSFVRMVEDSIGQKIDYVGLGPDNFVPVAHQNHISLAT